MLTETRQVTIPTVATNGTWWIDSGNAVTEWNENDNAVHSCMTINVTC